MPLTQDEIFANAGKLLILLGEASKVDSDGGVKITMSEVVKILGEVGIDLINDLQD